MSDTDFDTLAAEILQDPVARVAYLENKLRREIADTYGLEVTLSVKKREDQKKA